MGCRQEFVDAVIRTLRLREAEGLLGGRPCGSKGKGLVASACVSEEPAAGEGVSDEGDAGAAVRILVSGGGVVQWCGRDDAIAQRGVGGEGAVVCPAGLAGVGDEGGETLEEGKGMKTKTRVPSRQGRRRVHLTLPSQRI